MAQNHGSRARPWANVPLPNGPWAPFLAIAAVIATVALVANGPRIGGDSPAVPDGRAYATADSAPVGGIDHADPDDPGNDPPLAEPEPAPAPASTPRPRRRAPAVSHRKRRTAPARPRTRSPRGRAPTPTRRTAAAPGPATTWPAETATRRSPTPHRTPVSSAEREFSP